MTVRVYVPTTPQRLRRARADGGLGPSPLPAHAVTEAVRAALDDATEEDWEYAASSAAAQASVGLLAAEDAPRRLVVAVDVPHAAPAADDDVTLVSVDAVPWRRVAAVLADSAEAEGVVGRARDALLAGSADAEMLLELCLDHELGWWAVQEVDVLLEELGGPVG